MKLYTPRNKNTKRIFDTIIAVGNIPFKAKKIQMISKCRIEDIWSVIRQLIRYNMIIKESYGYYMLNNIYNEYKEIYSSEPLQLTNLDSHIAFTIILAQRDRINALKNFISKMK